MGLADAKVETAFTFIEVLKQADYDRVELDDYADGGSESDLWRKAWADTAKAYLIANATWVRRLIDSQMLAAMEATLRETPLQVRRNAFSGEVTIVTPGVVDGLRDKVAAERKSSAEESNGQYAAVQVDTFTAMLREAVIDWTLRTEADESYELRGCPQCSKWFEPQLKARSRFCSDKCRKGFNNLRNSGSDAANFVCHGCNEARTMDDFAGLRFEEGADKTVTPLRMGMYYGLSDNLCCVHCVRSNYPEWRRYIAPMESLSERVSA